MLLAIDTSAGCDVALVDADGRVLAEERHAETRRHAEVIGPSLTAVFERAGCGPADVLEVVVGIGPGPFTGLRVGVAAARAFALGRGIPVWSIPSHDAIAFEWRADRTGGKTPGVNAAPEASRTDAATPLPEATASESEIPGLDTALVATTDARRRQLAVSRYEPGCVAAAALPVLAVPSEVQVPVGAERFDATVVRAAALAQVHLARRAAGLEPVSDALLYLRAPDAVPSAGPKRVTAP